MTKALTGVRILDFTHVQSGPTCTQLLAWFGADVIKVERPGVGDITRGQLQDIPNVDSLYFTMLNHNKRSITLDTKNPKGKEVLTALIKTCDVLVENFGPGVLDRMGFPWEKIQSINPKMIVASIKGFGPGPYEDCKVYENVAQCTGGAASTTGFRDGLPLVTGAQIGDSGTGLHLALGIVTALYQRTVTGKGQKVTAAMQDGVLESGARQTARPAAPRPWSAEGIQPVRRRHPVRRRGAARRQRFRRRPARPHPQMQGLGDRSQRLHLFHHPGAGLGEDLRRDRRARLEDPSRLRQAAGPAVAAERDLRPHRAMDDDQDQVRGDGDPQQGRHPLRSDPVDEGTGRRPVAARHRHRGRSRSSRPAANICRSAIPIKLSDSPSEVMRSPLLGEHTDEILRQVLGFTDHQVAEIHDSGALDPPRKQAAE